MRDDENPELLVTDVALLVALSLLVFDRSSDTSFTRTVPGVSPMVAAASWSGVVAIVTVRSFSPGTHAVRLIPVVGAGVVGGVVGSGVVATIRWVLLVLAVGRTLMDLLAVSVAK